MAALRAVGMTEQVARDCVFRQHPEPLFLDYYGQFKPALQDLQRLFCEDSDAQVSGGHAAATSSAEPSPSLPQDSALTGPQAQGSAMPGLPQDSAVTGQQAQGSTRHVANTVLACYPHFVMFAVDEELSKSIKAKVEYLKSSGLDQAAISNVMLRYPNFIDVQMEKTFKPKVDYLLKTGFSGPLLCQLLSQSPEIMKLSKKQLERRWKYLHMVLRASMEDVTAEPGALLLHVYNDMGPASNYVHGLLDKDRALHLIGLTWRKTRKP